MPIPTLAQRKHILAELLTGADPYEIAQRFGCNPSDFAGETKQAMRMRAMNTGRGLTQVESELPENKSLATLGFEKAREILPAVGTPRDFKDWAQGLHFVMDVAKSEVEIARGTGEQLNDPNEIRERFRSRIAELSERLPEPLNVVDGYASEVDPEELRQADLG